MIKQWLSGGGNRRAAALPSATTPRIALQAQPQRKSSCVRLLGQSGQSLSRGRRLKKTVQTELCTNTFDSKHPAFQEQCATISVQRQLEATDCLQSPLVPTRIDSGSLVSRRIAGPQPERARAREPAISSLDGIKSKSQARRSGAQQPHETASLNPVVSKLIKTIQPNWHEEQQQYGSVNETDELIDRLHTSQMSGDSDYSRDELADGGCGVHRKHGGAQKSQQIKEREEVLETLRRDLGRLLRSANVN